MQKLYSIILSLAYGFILCLLPSECVAQVQRYNATAENDYGVVYTLPKTEYRLTMHVVRRHFEPGKYALWGGKLLGKACKTEAEDHYEILNLSLETVGIADTTKRYVAVFDKKSIAPFVSLMPNGVLYSINGSQPIETAKPYVPPTFPKRDNRMPALPREYSLASTLGKRAEIVASYLYEVREHAMNIVSGEVEQMPKDGESMRLILDKLRSEEQASLRLFEGDTTYTIETHRYTITPELEDMNGRLLCRFSPHWGVVSPDDLSGEALTFDLKIIERSPELSPKEQSKRDKIEGIVYNVPGTAELRISLEGRELLRERVPMTQVGTIQSFAKKMLGIKEAGTTALYFDPRSGALLRVTTE